MCNDRRVQAYFFVKLFVVSIGLVCGLLLASGVDRKVGWPGVVALVSTFLVLTSVLSVG